MTARPEGWWITKRKLWDPIWLAIHEGVAVPFWCLIGLRIDRGGSTLHTVMLCYLAVRTVFATTAIGPDWLVRVALMLQFFVWTGMAVYALVRAIQWASRTASAVRLRLRHQ